MTTTFEPSAHPVITWGDGARGPFIAILEEAARGNWTVQLTFEDGRKRDANVHDIEADGTIGVKFWRDDWMTYPGQPTDGRPTEYVSPFDITSVHIY